MLEYQIVLTLAILLVASPLYLHELGHYAALRRFGVPVMLYWIGLGPQWLKLGQVRLGVFPIGAAVVPQPEAFAALTPTQRCIVALAGPLASLCAGFIFLASWSVAEPLEAFTPLLFCASLNFFIGVVNLLPIPPLDGFQALSSWLASQGKWLSTEQQVLTGKVGSAVVYGSGAYCVTKFAIDLINKAST